MKKTPCELLESARYIGTQTKYRTSKGTMWGLFILNQFGHIIRCISSGPATSNNPEKTEGWEHVSVSLSHGAMPSWSDMKFVKELFWREDETVIQFHPKKSDYVNITENVLHLWKPPGGEVKLPPKECV